jgi:signal transduction histidine kinase
METRLDEVEALRRIATLVAFNHTPDQVLAQVTEEVARHLGADAAMTARFDSPQHATILADWAAPGLPAIAPGSVADLVPGWALTAVRDTAAPARVDSYADLEGAHAREMLELGMESGVAAPIIVDGLLWGAVAAGTAAGPFPPDAGERLGAFAELVGQAIANVDARMKLQASRARIVEAGDTARRRLERDLHDGAQQRLVSLAIRLRILSRRVGAEEAAAVEACIAELLTALEELRDLARGLHPAVLTEHGLTAALEALAARSALPVSVHASLPERLPEAQEVALYYVALEAITNVAKYAGAQTAEIRVRHTGGWAEIEISDDGVGGADAAAGSGLRGLADRVEALDGRLQVHSPPGSGTTLRATIPLSINGVSRQDDPQAPVARP